MRTERAFGHAPEQVREFLPQNPKAETLTYDAARDMVKTWVADLNKAEGTLAGVKDDKVKLPLHVGLIKIDLLGLGMMAVLEDAIPLAREADAVELDLAKLPKDDAKTYAMIRRADTVGVFFAP